MHTPHGNAGRAEWVAIGSYANGLEADIARSLLESADIPVLVRSNAPGIFGLAFQGNVAGGITLHVPTPLAERAVSMLDNADSAGDAYDADETMSP